MEFIQYCERLNKQLGKTDQAAITDSEADIVRDAFDNEFNPVDAARRIVRLRGEVTV